MIRKVFIGLLMFSISLLLIPNKVNAVTWIGVVSYTIDGGDTTHDLPSNPFLHLGKVDIYYDDGINPPVLIATIDEGVKTEYLGWEIFNTHPQYFTLYDNDEIRLDVRSDGSLFINFLDLGTEIIFEYDNRQPIVTFESNGGSAVADQDVAFGDFIIKPTNPTRSGYSFLGWYKGENLISAWNFNTDLMPNQDITLYAKWVLDIDLTIDDFLEDSGLNTGFGKALFTIIFVLIILIILALFKTPAVILLVLGISMLLLAIAIGWIPVWITILLTIIAFAIFYMSLKGGA